MKQNLRQPQFWLRLCAIFLGLAAGVGAYTFVYAKGGSYLTNDPAACANCHIMGEHYNGWLKSSHRSAATCNDCHTPPGFVSKYFTKAENGFRHSWGFTTGRFPDPLQIKPHNRKVTEQACRKCHQQIVFAIDAIHKPGMELSCVRCHRDVGHLH
jgi:cytochrome c nitrite reductase small subunit